MTYELRITSGHHEGAQCPLTQAPLVIGSDPISDIVLSDQGIEKSHLRLVPAWHRVTLTAKEGAVEVLGRGTVPAGHTVKLSCPFDLKLGETRMVLSRVSAEPRWPRPSVPGLAVGITPIAIAAFAFTPDFDQAAPVAGFASQTVVEQTDDKAQVPPARTTPKDALSALRSQIESAGITGEITTSVNAGVIIASAQLSAPEMDMWRAVERWFDGQMGKDVALVSKVRLQTDIPNAPDAPAIQSVWRNGTPFVTIDDIQYREGSTLPNGWHLKRIGPAAALFALNGQELEIRY